MKFQSTIQLNGKTATGIPVPVEVVMALGASKKPPVRVTINGHTYRTTVAVMGGVFMIPLSAEQRANAHVSAGDAVEVEIELDTAPREVETPGDLAEALAADADAKQFYDGLSYSHKRAYVIWIEGTKNAETRQKRVGKAVEMLRAGEAQP